MDLIATRIGTDTPYFFRKCTCRLTGIGDEITKIDIVFEEDNKEENPEEVLKRRLEEYKKYYEDVLKGYLKASKDMQKEILRL